MVLAVSFTFTCGLALANTDLSWGIKLLEKGQLNTSLDVFNELARQSPDNAEVHYWRGRALHALGRAGEAAKEYKLAIALGLPKALEATCKAKLADADEQSTTQAAAPDVPTKAAIDPPQIKETLKNILKQTEGRMKESIGEGNSRYYSRNQDFNAMAPWPAPQPFPSLRSRRLMPGLTGRAGRHSANDSYRQAAQSRAVAFHESALGLESQLTNKPHRWSGVYLEPTGTNLYVRNYSHFTPEQPEPLVPLQAEALLLDSIKNKPALKPASKQAPAANGQKR